MEKRVKKKIAIMVLIYIILSILILSPYLSSFAFIKYINQYVAKEITFNAKSWSYFISFYLKNKNTVEPVFVQGYKIAFASALIPFIAPFVITLFGLIIHLVMKKPKSVHGNSRLANDLDLSKSGFFADDKDSKYPAILIGKAFKGRFKNKFIKYIGQQFLMLYAPTRSGKGVGIVIPNCLYYRDSIVVLDIKLENFLYSAGHRQDNLGQEVFLFCPEGWEQVADSKVKQTHSYNPLAYIDRSMGNRATDLSKISSIIFAPTGGENDMWTGLSENLFQAIVLYLLDCENEKDEDGKNKFKVTLSEVAKVSVPQDGTSLGEFFTKEIESRNSKENLDAWEKYAHENGERPKLNRLDDETVRKMNQFASQAERQQGNILLTFIDEMKPYSNPVTAKATDSNDFDFREIRKKKMSIYIGLSPDGLIVYKKLMNLFFSQLIGQNVGFGKKPEDNPDYKYQCLLVLDEFTSLGKVGIIQESVAFTAGYNMRYMFILQEKSQLEDDKKGYGKEGAQTLIANCGVELIYPPKEVNDHIKHVSESIGYYDYITKTVSKTRGKNASSSHGEQINKRAVLLPQEIVDLREIKHKPSDISTREIIMSEACRPFLADKIIYFDEPYFQKRKVYSENNVPDIPTITVEKNHVMDSMLHLELILKQKRDAEALS